MKIAPCERLITPSTPNTSVKPSANSAYTQPSERALTSCCSSIAAVSYFSIEYLPPLVTDTIAACCAS